ncbi:thioester-containing protein 1 allele R1-like [Sabethes cyaneus]|uniref:thioester-containing protein 1 allele R1-like n=1 Tax=Sabethes cyaneus TaxID=53552 RepID=UPI00237D9A40|nr:thioester-containing protein 1 allele R1-like [Sabethes cyaneus]
MKSEFTVWLALLSIISIDPAHGTGHYAILAPNVINSGHQYQLSVSTFDLSDPPKLQLSIKGVSDQDKPFKTEQQVQFKSNETRLLEFNTTHLESGDYNLTIRSLSGTVINRTIDLTYRKSKDLVLIQTDKPIYRPGNIVKFRILVLDHQTRPLSNLQNIRVTLFDPEQNEIKVWRSATLRKGIFQSELEIANEPNVGNWTLTAEVRDESYSRVFPVEEYTLPNHEIRINTPKVITFDDKTFTVEIDAWYTFGKPMKGDLIVSVEGLRTSNVISKINGRTTVSFDVPTVLAQSVERSRKFIQVDVILKEKHTKRTFNATSTFPIFETLYQIHMKKSSKYFIPGKTYICWISISNHLGEMLSSHVGHQMIISVDFNGPNNFTDTVFLNPSPADDETSLLILDIPYQATTAELTVIYKESNQLFFLEKDPANSLQMFQVSILDRKPAVGKPISIQVQSASPLGPLVYQISTMHKINQVGRIDSQGNTMVTFDIPVEPEMIPELTIHVYSIQNGFLLTDSVSMRLHALPNTIEMTATEHQVKPGQKVELTIQSKPNSLVGLLAIDKRALLLNRDGILTPQLVFEQLSNTDAEEADDDSQLNDMIILSDAQRPIALTSRFGNYDIDEEDSYISPRNIFTESWMWDDIKQVGANGQLTVRDYAPDTLTSWEITAFALHPENGLAILESPIALKTFKPFFVMMNLPNSIKKSEIAVIEVSLFNYLEEMVYVGVTLKNTRQEFELVDNHGRKDASYQAINVVVPPNSAKSTKFYIKPKKMGNILVKVIAAATEGSDSVERLLRITPESLPYQNTIKRFIQVENSTQQFKNIKMIIPQHLDAGSEKINFTVYGNSPSLEVKNLANQISQPSGNGEQNIIQMIPSVVLLDNIAHTKSYDESTRKMAQRYVEMGYQNQLKYKRNDGSFSLSGNKDSSGNVFLTALVVKTLKQASGFITVDNKVIEMAFDWLQMQQNSDGSFNECPQKQNNVLQLNHRNIVTLTAYVLIAFLENQEVARKYETVISKGVNYLPTNYNEFDSMFKLSLVAYALKLANHTRKQAAFEELLLISKNDYAQSFRWWEAGPVSIDTTAYALLTMLGVGNLQDLEPIFNWLASKQYYYGVYENPQTTFVGLQAMSEWAKKMSPSRNSYEVTVKYGPTQKSTIAINPLTTLTPQKLMLPHDIRTIDVIISGTGIGVFELEYSYFSNILNMRPRFAVTVETLDASQHYLDLRVCAKFLPKEAYEETDLVLMEIIFPSGYIALDDSVEELESSEIVRKVATKHGDTSLLLYFDSLPIHYQCLNVTGFREKDVLQQVPGSVRIFDFYDNSRVAIAHFDGKELTVCDSCDDD